MVREVLPILQDQSVSLPARLLQKGLVRDLFCKLDLDPIIQPLCPFILVVHPGSRGSNLYQVASIPEEPRQAQAAAFLFQQTEEFIIKTH